MIFIDYKNKNYKSAIKLGSDFNSKYRDKKTAPYALYYAGKSYEKIGDKKQAENIFKNIISEYTNSYYALRAYQALKYKSSFNLPKTGELPRSKEIKYHFLTKDNPSYLLNKLVDFNDILTLDDFKIQDEFLKSYLAYKSKKHSYSIFLAREESENINKLNKTQAMLLYPLYYQEAINKYSKQNEVSPHLIIALIRKESHFDTSAKSTAGAIGLMQVLPATAYFIEKGDLKDDIKNINYNIYIGTKYFSYLKKLFNDNDMLAIASYNAGPGNVQKWIKGGSQDYDIFIEDIPFIETKSYVKRVFEGYWNYINLYR